MKYRDEVEQEYDRAILRAMRSADDESALELSVGLRQYKELYKVEPEDD